MTFGIFNNNHHLLQALLQKIVDSYGTGLDFYVEISTELGERGSRVSSFAQTVATKPQFIDYDQLYSELPPYWQQQIVEPQPILVIKHHLFDKGKAGYIKSENDVVTELSLGLDQGLNLKCRSTEPCRCD